MRSFEERKAEILRRSNKRISRRKTVKRCVLGITIPLFICAVSLSIVLNISKSNQTEPAKEELYESFNYVDAVQDATADSVYTADNRIIVTDSSGEVKNFADSNTVNEIMKVINTYLPSLPQAESDGECIEFSTAATAQGNSEGLDNNAAQKHNARYKIEIVDSDGGKTVFSLNGNLLTNIQNGEGVMLDDSVRDKLLKSFGF